MSNLARKSSVYHVAGTPRRCRSYICTGTVRHKSNKWGMIMSNNQNDQHKKSQAECTRVLFDGADAIRGGIAGVRKGLANLFLTNTAEGRRMITDGTIYIEKGVSQMRKRLTDECLIKTVESYEHVLSGIEYELQAIALLKEGPKRQEGGQPDNLQDVVHGLYLAEKGLSDIEKGGTGFHYQDNREVFRDIHESVKDIQESAGNIAAGLGDIKENRYKKGVNLIAGGNQGISKGLDQIQDSLYLLRDEEPEFFRLVLEGVQSAEEGQKKIKAGAVTLNEPDSRKGCPICYGMGQIEEGLRDVSEGVRDIRKGLSLLYGSDGPQEGSRSQPNMAD